MRPHFFKLLIIAWLCALVGCAGSDERRIREAIAEHVPTPSTVKIRKTEVVVSYAEMATYRVEVDCQNLQGAMVRSTWEVSIRKADRRPVKVAQTAGPRLAAER